MPRRLPSELDLIETRPAPTSEDSPAPRGRTLRGLILKAGLAAVVLYHMALGLEPLVSEAFPSVRGERERAAIAALRTISTCQVRFREGDRDNDNFLDYASSLEELGRAGLIGPDLASGVVGEYRFTLSGSTFDWQAAAEPVREASRMRHFTICTDGVIRFSPERGMECANICLQ